MSPIQSGPYSDFLDTMRLWMRRPRSLCVRRMICYRKILHLCCNRLVLSFLVGMVCLELLATFVSIDTQFTLRPLQVTLRILSDQNQTGSTEVTGKSLQTVNSDDVLAIQTGVKHFEDPTLLEYIRRQILLPSQLPLNLSDISVVDRSEAGQGMMVDKLLGGKHQGFFVEVGAGNGEDLSTTLFLERRRNWTGLLIEPHPQEFDSMLYKRRGAYTLNMCVSPSNITSLNLFRAAKRFTSGIKGSLDRLHQGYDFTRNPDYQGDLLVQCVPLVSILNALGSRDIDYLSLDVEGAETDILDTVPFDHIRINTLSIDYAAQGQQWDQVMRSLQRLNHIRETMRKTGLYEEAGILISQPELASVSEPEFRERYGTDVVFVRRDIEGWKLRLGQS